MTNETLYEICSETREDVKEIKSDVKDLTLRVRNVEKQVVKNTIRIKIMWGACVFLLTSLIGLFISAFF